MSQPIFSFSFGGMEQDLFLVTLHFLKSPIHKSFLPDHVQYIKTDSVYYVAWLLNIIKLFIIYVMRDYHDRKCLPLLFSI